MDCLIVILRPGPARRQLVQDVMMKSFHQGGENVEMVSCEPDGGASDNRVTWNKNRILMGVITSANGSTEPPDCLGNHNGQG